MLMSFFFRNILLCNFVLSFVDLFYVVVRSYKSTFSVAYKDIPCLLSFSLQHFGIIWGIKSLFISKNFR